MGGVHISVSSEVTPTVKARIESRVKKTGITSKPDPVGKKKRQLIAWWKMNRPDGSEEC